MSDQTKSDPLFTKEDLEKFSNWLKSPEGQQAIREASEEAERQIAKLEEMFRIDPKKLKEPYMLFAA